jgi:hypothetical protein
LGRWGGGLQRTYDLKAFSIWKLVTRTSFKSYTYPNWPVKSTPFPSKSQQKLTKSQNSCGNSRDPEFLKKEEN